MGIIIKNSKDINNYEISTIIDDYLKWYYKYMTSSSKESYDKTRRTQEIKNFIEKMAIWYELRFPDYEINRIFPGSNKEMLEVDKEMFNKNEYMDNIFDSFSLIRKLQWSEFYNKNVFINSLPYNERVLLQTPKYNSLVYLDNKRRHFHLSCDGYVEEAEYIYICDKGEDFFVGKHIRDVVKFLKENNALSEYNELVPAINNYENMVYQREGLLNSVMYRIIERGGNRIGPKRAFIFAKEFERNISIPMMYGIDTSDPGLGFFIAEYLKAGGNTEQLCIENYFYHQSKNQKRKLITINEIINSYLKNDQYILGILSENNIASERLEGYKKIKKV